MGAYKAIQETFISEYSERSDLYKQRIVKWSAEPPIVRADGPTNIPRARKLGYKAKEGVMIARVRVIGGTKKRPRVGGGRKPSKSGRFFSRQKSVQSIAEERASKKFTNFEVLNSYFVGEAGANKFYEVIMLNRNSPAIKADRQYAGIIAQKDRAVRGLTHAGKRHRGFAN